MQFHIVLILVMACSCLLPAQSSLLNFRESDWSESKPCVHCATCNGVAVDGTETQKVFEFYGDEMLVGVWRLNKIQPVGCDGLPVYQTNCDGKSGFGLSQFFSEEDAIKDICREVRFFLPYIGGIKQVAPELKNSSFQLITKYIYGSGYLIDELVRKPVVFASDEEVARELDERPIFPGCGGEIDGTTLKTCFNGLNLSAIFNAIHLSLKKLLSTEEGGRSGRVVIVFIVEKDGRVSNAKVMRGIDEGFDEAVLRIISAMNDLGIVWTPGQKNGQAVRTYSVYSQYFCFN